MGYQAAEVCAVGPFRADSLHEGDRYELSDGHPILCLPGDPDHAAAILRGAAVLETDPAVEWAGVDAGFSPKPSMLRAPDVAIGSRPQTGSGWIQGVPPFALEFAGAGQDEEKLQKKIADLLRAGTRLIWIARLVGPRRVEVYEPGKPMRTVLAGAELTAPGILKNPVPVLALFDRNAAHEVTLRNLLQRRGYESLAAVRAEGEAEGEARGLVKGILAMLASRGLAVDEATVTTIRATQDLALLDEWLARAAVVRDAAELVRPSTEPSLK